MRHSKLYSLLENVIFCTNNREQKENLTEKTDYGMILQAY
jgi:hypothetical protein